MEIIRFENLDTTSNTYLVIYEENKAFILDPGSDKYILNVLNYVKEKNINITDIVLTHGHYDHIIGIPKILEEKKVPIYISKLDKDFLYDPRLNLISWSGIDQSYIDNAIKDIKIFTLEDGDNIFGFKVLSTPGHTHGGISLLNIKDKQLITGDTLFKGSYGRFDLPTGNGRDLRDSINKLLKLEKDIIIYPGHGELSTIYDEFNSYYLGY